MRKLAAPFLTLGLAVALTGAAVAASAPADGMAPHVFTDGALTLKLTPAMPGITFSGDTLVCPPQLIMTSSGKNLSACQFTISSIGAVAPTSVTVTMTVSGVTPAQVAAHKFAVAPSPGPLVHLQTTSQTLYTFTGADLPVTVNPGVVWGANAGTALDNGDLGATIVITYTVVAEAESVQAETATPGRSQTLPPTGSARGSSSGTSTPLLALLICLLLGGIGLITARLQRRSIRR